MSNTPSVHSAGSLRAEADGAADAVHQDETAEGDPEVGAEADEDDALHLWGLLRHLHAGRRRQDGKYNCTNATFDHVDFDGRSSSNLL